MALSLDDIDLHLQVRQALAVYSHAVDHGDLDAALGVYWPEAADHHGGIFDGTGHDFVRWLIDHYTIARAEGFPATGPMHHVTSVIVKRTGETSAKSSAYFLAWVPGMADGEYGVNQMQGRMLDSWEKRGDEWRISERVVVSDYTSRNDLGEVWASGSWQEGGFVAGGFGPTDPGVAFLK